MENKDRMVFTVTAYNKTVTIDVSDDLAIYDFLDHCHDLALAMGYDMNTWREGVIEMSQYYLEEEEKQVEKNLREYGNHMERVFTGPKKTITNWGPLHTTDR